MSEETTGAAGVPQVYRAISAVQAELAESGISKGRKNAQQGYSFRGIDDVYNALSEILARHGLCILPTYSEREVVERATKSGGALFYTTLRGQFDLVSTEDGSRHTITTYGEAMDSADKSTNKAMSAALKYACLQAFMIPTEGDNDADAKTPEVAPRAPEPSAPKGDGVSGSEKQRAMIWAIASKLWTADAREQLEAICQRRGWPVSSRELSKAQASAMIEHLQKLQEASNGQ